MIELRPNAGPQEAFLATAADIAIYGGAAGSGKMLRVDEPIPTPNGWTAMGDLRDGDFVFDEHGRPTRITIAHPVRMPAESWRLTFDDGSSIESCAEHQWLTYDAKELSRLTKSDPDWRARRRASRPSRATGRRSAKFTASVSARNATRDAAGPAPVGTVRTTGEIAATLLTPRGRRNHAMPVAKPLECPDAALPLDPYLLGVWLGDGTTSNGSVTSADPEIMEAFRYAGHSIGAIQAKPGNAASSFRVVGLTALLDRMGVRNRKHIPCEYLRASEAQRVALLQGLMDSDGHASATGAIEFTTTLPALRDGFAELVASLGVKARAAEGVAKLNGREISPKWRFTFTAPFVAFRLPRKASRQRLAKRRTTAFRYVVSAVRVDPHPMRCITVEGSSSLYLAGRSMLVTHNSFAVTLDVLRHVHRKGFGAIYLRRESNRLTGPGSLWEEMSGIYPHLGSLAPRARQTPALEWRFPSGALIQLSHLQYEKDKHAHQSKQYAGIYFEEICEFEETQFWYLVSRLRTTCGIRPYVRGTCNPDPDSFVRRLIDWWIGDDGLPILERSGVLRWLVRDGDDIVWFDSQDDARERYPDRNPLSFTFIAASLADNPKGDPTYRDKLMAMSRVDRERLLGGNWNIRAANGEVFRRVWFPIVDAIDESLIVAECRAWDLAASEVSSANPNPDWTAGVKVARMRDGSFVIRHVERGRMTPSKVEDTLDRTAAHDGKRCVIRIPQDPGQAGKDQATRLVARLAGRGYQCRALRVTGDKVERAKAPSALAERGLVSIVRGPWNEALLAELESFPDGAKDDQVDAMADAFAQLAGPVVGFSQTRPTRLGFEL